MLLLYTLAYIVPFCQAYVCKDPAGIIKTLNLRRPIYPKTASYGHFGRAEFPWEKTDKAEELKKVIG